MYVSILGAAGYNAETTDYRDSKRVWYSMQARYTYSTSGKETMGES